jgi:hypothetical protein
VPLDFSKLRTALVLAVGAALILALTAGGVFGYLFMLLAVALVIAVVATLSKKSDPAPLPQPLAAARPVFEDSIRFAGLDPFTSNEQRKSLAQQLEGRIGKGDVTLTRTEAGRADAAEYELDRIGLYFWEEHIGDWPSERGIHVRHEFERIKNAGKPKSLMPLHYALRAFDKCLRQARSEPSVEEKNEVLNPILSYVAARPEMDTTNDIKSRLEQLLQSKAAVPAVPSQAAPEERLIDYTQVREERFRQLAEARPIRLHIESFQAFVSLNDNGDAVMMERFEMVSSEGSEAIPFLPAKLETSYGFVPDVPKYYDMPEGQTIEWKFIDEKASQGEARIAFTPPVGRAPISFARHWTQFNAVYFNQADRADSGSPGSTESVAFPVLYRYDQLRIRISFPGQIFPGEFTVRASREDQNGQNIVDADESAWAAQSLDWDEKDGVVWLGISRPLTNYSYEVVWNLPPSEGAELKLTTQQSNTAEDLSKRFGSLANKTSPYRGGAIAAMQALGAGLEAEFGGDLRLMLYCYSSQNGRGGLLEVLERNGYNLTPKLVTIGRTLVGRSYRRKSALVYQSVFTGVENDKSFEPVPFEEGLPNPSVAIAVPLLCPEPGGRRAAVLYVSTRTADSKLVDVWNPGASRATFSRKVKHWYANEMCSALDMNGALQAMMPKQ